MSGYLLPLAATVAAVAVTYLFCIRPMRRGGHCALSMSTAGSDAAELDSQIAKTRAELARLRGGGRGDRTIDA